MGKNKGKTNNDIKREKFIRQLVIVASVVALFWAWMLYITRPATEENTYQCQGKIDEVVLDRDGSRNITYDLMVYIGGDCYTVDLDREANIAEVQEIASRFVVGEDVSLMVWKRPIPLGQYFDYMYYHPKEQFCFLQIVEATCDGETLWSLETHNALQRPWRVMWCIFGGIITVLIGGGEFWAWNTFYPRRNKKKQKRSDPL